MPFTLSHPAAVLPLRRTGLPMAALVCGSMAPDLHMLVPGVTDAMTHRWQGVPTIDLVLGYALTAFWVLVLAAPFTAAMPRWVRERLRPRPRYSPRQWLLAVPGVVVGAVTHVGWDTFTHEDMWGGQHVPWLYEIHHGHPGFEWTQYGSSVVGLLVVGAWALWLLRRRVPRAVPAHPRATTARLALGVPLLVGLLVGAAAVAVLLGMGQHGKDFLLAVLMRSSLIAASLLAFLGAAAWTLTDRVRGHGPRHDRTSAAR